MKTYLNGFSKRIGCSPSASGFSPIKKAEGDPGTLILLSEAETMEPGLARPL